MFVRAGGGILVLFLIATIALAPAAPQTAVMHTEDEREAAPRFGSGLQVQAPVYRAAVEQKARLQAAAARIAGATGSWEPMGTGVLHNDEPGYDSLNPGWANAEGRISDFAYDPAHDALYAAVADGGVWRSEDRGRSWTSIGDSLPTQIVASVAWTPAGGGTLLALTGDGVFVSFAGLGVYRSTDGGATWQHAAGVPDGGLAWKIAIDPTDPSVAYAATGLGLYRSRDAGRTFDNVVLPTGACAGKTVERGCVFANMVTDVVVQAPDGYGHAGGRVLAGVGWPFGADRTSDGLVMAPANGLYASDSGLPGTFVKLDPLGFTPQERIGRVELGVAEGTAQNHDYVYALVQDVRKMFGRPLVTDAEVDVPYPTTLDGIYASADFGRTWTVLATAEELRLPTTSSALSTSTNLSAEPGIQAWYNMFVRPDPTRELAGVPTRLVFGLEELWENDLPLPQIGRSSFHVIGRYWNANCLDPVLPVCPDPRYIQSGLTTHPDQHGAIWLPEPDGGVTLVVGNDGGAYRQTVGVLDDFTNAGWGEGTNDGFNTLLAYQAAIAADGTVWAGLQDNGTAKIQPDGRQIEAYGGDGVLGAVDPRGGSAAYAQYPGRQMLGTTDGGRTWRVVGPRLNEPMGIAPLGIDPRDPDHLVLAGREIVEAHDGPRTFSGQWRKVFDLGTRLHPGDASAEPAGPDDYDNSASAIAVDGGDAYAGYAGAFLTFSRAETIATGLATNVGGDWHIAGARGLQGGVVTAVAIDPADHGTVYVTTGEVFWTWPSFDLVQDAAPPPGAGHVFKSTDAGETFHSVSGDLPDIIVRTLALRGAQLIVGTPVGVFISADDEGTAWAPLGTGLPAAPVSTVQLVPGDPGVLMAATYGRGMYRYRFA